MRPDRLHQEAVMRSTPRSNRSAPQGATTKKNASEAGPLRRFHFFLFLARLAGFEPTTPWFVAKYSIQLSYSR